MTLTEATVGNEYKVVSIQSDDEELIGFLFSLGCFEGETVGLKSTRGSNYTMVLRHGKYTIDRELANSIQIAELS